MSVKRYFELEPDLSPIFYSTLNSNSVQFFYVVPKIKVTLKEHFNAFSTKQIWNIEDEVKSKFSLK